MSATEKVDRKEVSAKILAETLYELNPARTKEEWLEHVKKTAHNPAEFFNGNGEGLEEYNAFTRTYDKDTHDKVKKIRRR